MSDNNFTHYRYTTRFGETGYLNYQLERECQIVGGKKTLGHLFSIFSQTDDRIKKFGNINPDETIEVTTFSVTILVSEHFMGVFDLPRVWPENLEPATWQKFLFFAEQVSDEPKKGQRICTPNSWFPKGFTIHTGSHVVLLYAPSIARTSHGRNLLLLEREASGRGGGDAFGNRFLMVKEGQNPP